MLGETNLPAPTNAQHATRPAQEVPVANPANQAPKQASVSWDSRGLEIEAFNSSLNQILRQVAVASGGKLEGLTQDQRVFGSYGPGPERDVLLQLLEGSGYNVLMIGGRDTGAPLKIVLSAKSLAGPQTAANNQNRNNTVDDEGSEPPEPEPDNSAASQLPEQIQPFTSGNGDLPHDPAEFMQGILQRQEKIDQQQQQQDQQKIRSSDGAQRHKQSSGT